jgi:hypothetical protein
MMVVILLGGEKEEREKKGDVSALGEMVFFLSRRRHILA